MPTMDYIFAIIPLIPPGCLIFKLLVSSEETIDNGESSQQKTTMLAYLGLSLVAFLLTNSLVSHIKVSNMKTLLL